MFRMARYALGSLIAPVLVTACVAAAVPSAKTVHETQVLHATAEDVRAPRSAPSADGERADAAIRVEPPVVAVHTVEEKVEPKSPVAESFTRTIDRAWIEARGASRLDAGFGAATLREAASLDNGAWKGEQRRELLAYLRGDVVAGDARFTETDAFSVAQIQAGTGAAVNGVLTDETMAVLLATGFQFTAHKARAHEVKLEFYPGEIEDLDAWNREIEEKVMKQGGGFDEVNAPDGEGTIYVYVGSSLVASYRARGGPPSPIDDDGEHVAVPTAPGVYKLGAGHPHVSSNWYYSQIPWGAEIRKNEDGYEYRSAGQTRWSWATIRPARTLKDPFDAEDFEDLPEVTKDGATTWIWNKNDFGPIAWNLGPSDLYVHTTPHTEAQHAETGHGVPSSLGVSHGCVHIDPSERDEMVKRGYLAKNIVFVVRPWDDHLLPEEIRHELIAGTALTSPAQR